MHARAKKLISPCLKSKHNPCKEIPKSREWKDRTEASLCVCEKVLRRHSTPLAVATDGAASWQTRVMPMPDAAASQPASPDIAEDVM